MGLLAFDDLVRCRCLFVVGFVGLVLGWFWFWLGLVWVGSVFRMFVGFGWFVWFGLVWLAKKEV